MPFNFELEKRVESFEWDNKKYTRREASAATGEKYRATVLECVTIGEDGKPSSFDGMAATSSLPTMLLGECVFPEGGDKPVGKSVIGKWPDRVVNELYNRLKEISELDETEDDEESDQEDSAKNE